MGAETRQEEKEKHFDGGKPKGRKEILAGRAPDQRAETRNPFMFHLRAKPAS